MANSPLVKALLLNILLFNSINSACYKKNIDTFTTQKDDY